MEFALLYATGSMSKNQSSDKINKEIEEEEVKETPG